MSFCEVNALDFNDFSYWCTKFEGVNRDKLGDLSNNFFGKRSSTAFKVLSGQAGNGLRQHQLLIKDCLLRTISLSKLVNCRAGDDLPLLVRGGIFRGGIYRRDRYITDTSDEYPKNLDKITLAYDLVSLYQRQMSSEFNSIEDIGLTPM